MLELECVHKVLLFIDENYNKQISIQQLEEISNYSYRNIQRIFKKIFNETIGEFKTRLKLENGHKQLIYSDKEISDISIDVGYESNQAFSKAFKIKYAYTPKEARLNKLTVFTDFIQKNDTNFQKPQIEFHPEQIVKTRLIVTDDYENETINDLWKEIYSFSNEKISTGFYGLIIDQPLISLKVKSRYEACFAFSIETQKKENVKSILGRKYAKYTHLGSYSTILETYRKIYFDWIYNQTFKIDESPIVEHYQIGRMNSLNSNEYKTHILIPIK